MELKNTLKTIISNFHNSDLPEVLPRDKEIPTNINYIVAVIGARKAGKTYLVFETIKKLIESGIRKKQIIYINFEDERLNELKASQLDYILQAYRELYPNINMNDVYIFLDEIQNVKGWEKFVRRIFESITKNIVITGSNSTLLGSEIATTLSGRTYTVELFPLSFKEFLEFKGITNKLNDYYNSTYKARMMNGLEEYLLYGGIPDIVKSDKSLKIALLQEHFNTVIFKDLIQRYKITNLEIISLFLKQLVNSNSKEFSINKIYNSFRSIGLKTGRDILYEYLIYTQNIYFSFVLNKYERNLRIREQTSKKFYSIDTGLVNAILSKGFDSKTKLFENMLFLSLYRNNKEIYFYKEEQVECDFILYEKDKAKEAIQVSYSIEEQNTKNREITGLIKACKALNLHEGTIIIYDGYRTEEEVESIKIHIIPAIEYLLSYDLVYIPK
ncbi:ATP-binding protein [Patescibacteria group bacterium]|nr:ATP-binding protein [Patescibacteria group bacterium]